MLDVFVSILSNPSIIIAIIAGLGLVALRKSASDVIKGTMKTLFGFLILQQGANIIVGSLIPFSTMFTEAFGLTGIVAEDNAIAAAVQTVLGKETAFILIFSFLINVAIARFTKFKYIFLTGHMMFSFAATMAIVFSQMGLSTTMTIIWGSIVQGISMVFFPAISQSSVRKVIGNDNVAFGFWGSSWISLSGWIGGIFGNKEQSSEDVKVPKSLDFLKDMSILMGIIMVLVYVITASFVDSQVMNEISGGVNRYQYVIFEALGFVVGILILLMGVRMFLGEIVPAFKGIGEKNRSWCKTCIGRPYLLFLCSCSSNYRIPYSISRRFNCNFYVQLFTSGSPPISYRAVLHGWSCGVFGNARGGLRGAVISGFFLGFTFSLLVALAYPLIGLSEYGIGGLWFASPDAIIVVILIKLVGLLFGIGF